MKACIVVGSYYSPGQTFVNRHIQYLFEGNTCVIADYLDPSEQGPLPIDGRFHQRQVRPRPLWDRLTAPILLTRMYIESGTGRGSWGIERERVLEFLKRQKPDVVLAEFGPQGVVIAPIARAAGIPVFCYFRGSDASSRIRHKHVQKAYRKMMPMLDGVFAVSQFLLDNLARVGVEHPNSVVIPSGVDVRSFRPGQKRPQSYLGIGRFVEKKAPLLTIRAFVEATKGQPDARLTMIGDGDLLEAARSLIRDLDAETKVSLPGALPHDQVCAALAEAEVYLQHSVTARNGNTEGLPTAIQEAMASGCITLSTRHAGIPEAIDHGQTGFLVNEHDAVEFTRTIGKISTLSSIEKTTLAAKSRAVAEQKYDNAKLLKKLENEFERVCLANQ